MEFSKDDLHNHHNNHNNHKINNSTQWVEKYRPSN